MVEEKYRIKASCLVIAHIAIGAWNGVGIQAIFTLLVKTPNSEMDCIMRIFQCNNVVTVVRVLAMVFNPLGLGARVRKDCIVGRKETSHKSRSNGVGVWSWCVDVVVRDLNSAQKPLKYILVEYLGVLSLIWVLRIMHFRLLSIVLGSHQAWQTTN